MVRNKEENFGLAVRANSIQLFIYTFKDILCYNDYSIRHFKCFDIEVINVRIQTFDIKCAFSSIYL